MCLLVFIIKPDPNADPYGKVQEAKGAHNRRALDLDPSPNPNLNPNLSVPGLLPSSPITPSPPSLHSIDRLQRTSPNPNPSPNPEGSILDSNTLKVSLLDPNTST